MSVEKARAALAAAGFPGQVYEHPDSSATVELAAACLGCEPALESQSVDTSPF